MTDQLSAAVHGWDQAIGIVRKLRDGLAFTVSEMKSAPSSFPKNERKARQFADAESALRLASDYLAAMDVNGESTKTEGTRR